MNLVIPLLNNGNYEQLRFALRSITKHHSITTCVLVGGKPSWFTGTHIPHKDYGPIYKEHNIRDKVAFGVEYLVNNKLNASSGEDVLSGLPLFDTNFLFANDDHILLEPITKVYNKGLLSDCLSKRIGNGSYTRCLRNTFERYGDVPNVDTHCPMFMTAKGVKRTVFEWPAYGIGFKTCYAQENGIESYYMEDCKTDKMPQGRLWFSMTDGFKVKELFALFPHKCKFEA